MIRKQESIEPAETTIVIRTEASALETGAIVLEMSTIDQALRGRREILVGPADGVGRLTRELMSSWRGRRSAELSAIVTDQDGVLLIERLREESPDEVYFVLEGEAEELVATRVAPALLMDGIAVHFVWLEPDRPPVRARTTRVGQYTFVSLHAVSDALVGRVVRRALDVLGAGLLLLLLSPLLAVVAALVWWNMGGPIFHVQQRVGRGARLFPLCKFRSMVVDAERVLRASPDRYRRYVASNFKLVEDPRITPFGHFIRKTSLDELPQLWNVLRGDMSLVGPRPVVPEEVAQYGGYAGMLLRVKPGLTGAWQVGGRSTIGYPERARIDLRYVGSRSLRDDVGILFRTLPAVLRGRGVL